MQNIVKAILAGEGDEEDLDDDAARMAVCSCPSYPLL